MANKSNSTIFQRLTNLITTSGTLSPSNKTVNYTLPSTSGNEVLYTFSNKADYEKKMTLLKQQKLLSYQWLKSGYDTSIQQAAGSNTIKQAYIEHDRMDLWPEIGAALDIYAEEACVQNPKTCQVINVHSKSDRIKSVLDDLFVNRLDVNVMLEMITRSLCKYGNEFMLLNIDSENGVMGWRELPVREMTRVEGGMLTAYGGAYAAPMQADLGNMKPNEVRFVWDGHNEQNPYRNWQVAHFRLIKDSFYLPYGSSILNKARRHWKILSMMEDAMLLYRLERSIERRIFKVNVGLIDDADVPAFLQEFMNNVKRAPIIDPMTGMMDLRKNFLDVSADYVIPVRSGQDPTSIETLAGAQNQTSMDDIEYIEKKVFAGLRIPKEFLNFQDSQGKSQNLSILDIRFARNVMSIQKALLMELNKIAIIHLYLLGFEDEITNFSLTMTNPSNQLEQLVLDNQQKRINNATLALAEQGCGIPLMSWHKVQKEIMGLTDAEISDMLNEIRLEAAIAVELQLTSQIIKKTNVFRKVDNLYGEPGAKYDYSQLQGDDGGLGGGMGGGAPIMGGGFGDDLGDLGAPGAEEGGPVSGEEGEADLGGADMGNLMEGVMAKRALMTENKKLMGYIDEYKKLIERKEEDKIAKNVEITDKAFILNENINSILSEIENTKEEDILE
jgi:hypothetical protein